MTYLLLIGGLLTLIVSGELMVKGATHIALRFKISTLVIGLTVVAFGTSAPELLVSIQAALKGKPDIAIGNVVGSNICNLGLVLALTALVYPIRINKNSIRIDWPMMMVATGLLYIFILDKTLGLGEGILFVAVLIIFGVWLLRKSRKEGLQIAALQDPYLEKKSRAPLPQSMAFVLLGCVGLVYGADWFI